MTWWRHEMNSHLRLLNDPSPESSVHVGTVSRERRTNDHKQEHNKHTTHYKLLSCLFVPLCSSRLFPPVGSLAWWGGWYYSMYDAHEVPWNSSFTFIFRKKRMWKDDAMEKRHLFGLRLHSASVMWWLWLWLRRNECLLYKASSQIHPLWPLVLTTDWTEKVDPWCLFRKPVPGTKKCIYCVYYIAYPIPGPWYILSYCRLPPQDRYKYG